MSTSAIDRKKTLSKVRGILGATSAPFPISAFSSSPRMHRAFLMTIPIIPGSMLLGMLGIGLVLSAIVFAVVWQSTPNETWEERFVKLLRDYQPLDEVAYQELLTKIKDNTADRKAIAVWLQAEMVHVEHPRQIEAERALLDARLK